MKRDPGCGIGAMPHPGRFHYEPLHAFPGTSRILISPGALLRSRPRQAEANRCAARQPIVERSDRADERRAVPGADDAQRSARADAPDYLERHDRDFPVVVNQQAFKDENAEAGDIYESPVRLAPSPRIRMRGQILRELLRQVQTGNAIYFLKPGVIEITTHSAVTSTQLLNQTVD